MLQSQITSKKHKYIMQKKKKTIKVFGWNTEYFEIVAPFELDLQV